MNSRPDLYLTLEIAAGDAGQAAAALETALKAAPAASVLLRPAAGGKLDAAVAKTLAGLIQKRGIAALIAGDADLARMVKADGVHLAWSKDVLERYKEARATLGERYSIGAGAGRSRDTAMMLGEAGADYIAFGIPPHVEDRATAEDRQRELVAWWSEIFQVPCVVLDIATADQAQAVANSGAEFVEAVIASTMPASDITRRVLEFAGTIAAEATPA